MFIHAVYFWFKPDADPERVAEFESGLRRLLTIPRIKQAYFGRPELTPERDVIDRSYAWGLYVHFESVADHDAYQSHALHDEFVERFGASWSKVRVYDTRLDLGGLGRPDHDRQGGHEP